MTEYYNPYIRLQVYCNFFNEYKIGMEDLIKLLYSFNRKNLVTTDFYVLKRNKINDLFFYVFYYNNLKKKIQKIILEKSLIFF